MRKKMILILSILIVLIIGIAFGIKVLDSFDNQSTIELNMYFFNADTSSLSPEKRTVKYDKDENVVEAVAESFIKGANDPKNTSAVSKKTKINSITQEAQGIVVDFSKEFLSDNDTKNVLAVYATIKTICQIPGISQVKVTVCEEAVLGPDKKEIGFLASESINIENEKDTAQTKYVTLYFADKETSKLVKEMRQIKITDTQPVEKHIINELIKGPHNEALKGVLTSDTSVISIETTDGTCFVNFEANFVEKNSGSPEKESLAIYSVVNSLTELESIKNVQFLVDGKKISELGKTPINESFYKNASIEKE